MKIKSQIIVGGLVLALGPLAISSAINTLRASSLAEDGLKESTAKRLVADTQAVSEGVTNYFELLGGVLLSQASNPTVIDAMGQFQQAYNNLPQPTASMKQSLLGYYENDFSAKYANKNPGNTAPVAQITAGFDDQSWYLQHTYISGNPADLGAKDEMVTPSDGTAYSRVHANAHPYVRSLLYQFELYDIFFADINSGDIIYSVFKELDYTTSLKTGPYANSGIGEAFAQASTLNRGELALTQFAPYTPSYSDPAAFMGTPIFDQGRKIGVLIFQMPLGEINALMTHDGKWAEKGLGETGQTLLLGANGSLLNETREITENPGEAIAGYESSGQVSAQTLARMRSNQSTVGSDMYAPKVVGVNSTIIDQGVDPVGELVVRSIAPLSVLGQDMFVISEVARAEATAAATTIKHSIMTTAGVMTALFGVLAFVGVTLFVRTALTPLNVLAQRSEELASSQGADLTQSLDASSNNEISYASASLNRFFARIREVVQKVVQSANVSGHLAQRLNELSEEMRTDVGEQTERTAFVASATTQMSSSIREIAASVEQAAVRATDSNSLVRETQSGFDRASQQLGSLDSELAQSGVVITALASKTEEIGRVLDVIRDIAEQTNLLALNAAIEAARAGEQGRGFAVVADEVRQLASRTQASTQEVDQIIAALQDESTAAVKQMDTSSGLAKDTLSIFQTTHGLVTQVADNIGSITGELNQVATAAEEQSAVTSEIANNLEMLGSLSDQVNTKVREMSNSVEDLNRASQDTQQVVGVFKV